MEERHPIPQNVTGFQFKLIGDMTIKQFAYLAINIALAYLIYLLPVLLIFKLPFILFFVLLGVFLAFIPYQGRPLDRWLVNFFKAVFSSNQYAYKMSPPAEPVKIPEPPLVSLAFPPASKVRTISQDVAPALGIPSIPQVPNLISGIVKDTKGNTLPNILVEVKDEKGNVVRVFRTNKLGQFTAATQIENGAYTLELEDPRGQFKFDKITLAVKGEVLLPLEIKNLEPREELRRKVFQT